MEISTAIHLIRKGIANTKEDQTWADLGSGQGLFTKALSSTLGRGVIYAVDKNLSALKKVSVDQDVELRKLHADFITTLDQLPLLDGVLMANALHFVPDANKFGEALLQRIKPNGRVIIVEYDLDSPNTWVPYPLNKDKLKTFALRAGFNSISFLEEAPSAYHHSGMYSALLLR